MVPRGFVPRGAVLSMKGHGMLKVRDRVEEMLTVYLDEEGYVMECTGEMEEWELDQLVD